MCQEHSANWQSASWKVIWIGTMSKLEVVLDPWFKGGQGWNCGHSFREAVPLKDGAGKEGLLLMLGSVERHIKGAGASLVVTFLLIPCSWHILGVFLQQTMLEFVEHAESGFVPSWLQWLSVQLFKHGSYTGYQLVVFHGPLCCMTLDFLNGVDVADGPIQD